MSEPLPEPCRVLLVYPIVPAAWVLLPDFVGAAKVQQHTAYVRFVQDVG